MNSRTKHALKGLLYAGMFTIVTTPISYALFAHPYVSLVVSLLSAGALSTLILPFYKKK